MTKRISSIRTVFSALILVLLIPFAAIAQQNPADLLSKLPAQNAAEAGRISAELIKLGPVAITEICGQLVPMGAGDDVKARYALSGLAKYVTRDGAEAERKVVADAFVEALGSAKDTEVKTFLINQLQLAGKDECVPALGGLLAAKDLCEPATQALAAIGTPRAAAALEQALPASQDANRITLMKALGDLRSKPAAKEIAKSASSQDRETRLTALYALANIGDRGSETLLAKAAQAAAPYERAKATSFYLLYAQRLAEGGGKKQAEQICRGIIRTRTDQAEANVPSAALSVLVSASGKRALPDLLAAMDSPSKEYRAAALALAAKIPGRAATKKWLAKMREASPDARAEIAAMLGRRGDEAALPAVFAALTDKEKAVRAAAIPAATRLGGAKAVPELMARLKAADQEDEVKAVHEALLRLPTEPVAAAAVAALPQMPAPAQKALLEILGARRAASGLEAVFALTANPDEGVRVAAIKALATLAGDKDLARLVGLLVNAKTDAESAAAQEVVVAVAGQIADREQRAEPVLAALAKAAGEPRARVLRALAGVGGKRALEAVVADMKNSDAAVKDAATRALADWPDIEAADQLLAVAKGAEDVTYQVLAIRGYLRLAAMANVRADRKVAMCKDAFTAAKRSEEQKLALAALGNVRAMESLRLLAGWLDDPALAGDAALAAVKAACPEDEDEKGIMDAEAAPILKKALTHIEDAKIRERVEQHISFMPVPDADGFVPLFNGKDLSGWAGDTKGYVVEDGTIVCRPGGNLYTEKDYANFVVRFEFKLTAGANNGLGIRVPLGYRDAAYDGMEIQILDDSDPQYKDLHPYQYHGSVYGIVSAERGHLKPVGEWNSEEVTGNGRRVTVKLNGAIIVDADLDKAATPKTLDGKAHPGLKNEKGRIAFCGHGTVVEFRNLRVKELK